MAIQFNCQHCGKTLSTTDDKAGRKAKCPGCGEVLSVPEPAGASPADEPHDDDQHDEMDDLPVAPPPLRKKSSDAESSGTGSSGKLCPMCGAENKRSANRCNACGEEFEAEEAKQRNPRSGVEIGEILSDAWETYKSNLGLSIAANLLAGIIIFIGFMPCIILVGVIAFTMDQQKQHPELPMGLLLGLIPAGLVGMLVASYIVPGFLRYFIMLARHDHDPDFTTLFKGGRFMIPYIWTTLVYGLCYILGMPLLCIGSLVVVMFGWPISYVVCDPDNSGDNYFQRTLALTRPNWVTSLLLVLIMFGVQIGLGIISIIPFLGTLVNLAMIIFNPYLQLIWATGYVKMSGQD